MRHLRFDGRYGTPVFSTTLTVPQDYIFENSIDNFIASSGGSIRSHPSISDSNFARVSNKFIPGETYNLETVAITEYIENCQRCLADLNKEENILFFGAQGLVLFRQQLSWWPPKGKLLSFDQKENLFHNNQVEQVPYMSKESDTLEFSTINFWSSLGSKSNHLLLFYKR
jgi:hypothetical protein